MPESSLSYVGHGVNSISQEMLARYASKSLPSSISAPIERLLDVRSEPYRGVLTPDGKRYFFTWEVTGCPQVWCVDGPHTFPVQLTAGKDATAVKDIVADGKILVIARDHHGEENPGLYLMSVDGGALTVVQHLPHVQTQYVGCSADGTTIYFRSNDQKNDQYTIYQYNLFTQERQVVFDQPGLWSVADISANGVLLLVRATGGSSQEYFRYTPNTRKLAPLFGHNEQAEYSAFFGADDEQIIVQTNALSNFSRLYVFERGNFAPLSPEVPYDVEAFTIPRCRNRVVYTLNEKGYVRTQAIELATRSEISALPTPAGAEMVLPGASTPDGRYTVFRLVWAERPATTMVYEWATGIATSWLRPSVPEIDLRQCAKAELIDIPVRDGSTIPAFIRRPLPGGTLQRVLPVIVSFHGGPEGQSFPGFDQQAQAFVQAGYIFVEPNVRGSTGYGKAYAEADNGRKRLQVITDIEDVALYVKRYFAVDGVVPKIGVFGGSYGGYSTLMAMTRFAGAYDAGVSIVGMSNLLSFLNNTAPYRRPLRISEYGDPEKDREALIELSPITHIEKIRSPLLLIQGATDPRVPVGEALQMYEAVKERGVKTDLIIFPDEGHGMRLRANQVLALGHSIGWFDAHLG